MKEETRRTLLLLSRLEAVERALIEKKVIESEDLKSLFMDAYNRKVDEIKERGKEDEQTRLSKE